MAVISCCGDGLLCRCNSNERSLMCHENNPERSVKKTPAPPELQVHRCALGIVSFPGCCELPAELSALVCSLSANLKGNFCSLPQTENFCSRIRLYKVSLELSSSQSQLCFEFGLGFHIALEVRLPLTPDLGFAGVKMRGWASLLCQEPIS